MRRDYIFILCVGWTPFRFYLESTSSLGGIVVEHFPIWNFAADYPILFIFKHSRLTLFHVYVVVKQALRIFQQLDVSIILYITI